MEDEIRVIKKNATQMLSKIKDISTELKKHDVARTITASKNLICTISIMKIPDDPEQEVRLFEELDKLQGVIKK